MADTINAKAAEKKSVEMLKKELPPDWELVKNPEVKKPYYWNKRTNQTSWKFPHAEGRCLKQKVFMRSEYPCVLTSVKGG